MALKLVVTTNANGDVFELPLNHSKYRIGRRRDNDLRIHETYISGYHSELIRTPEGDYELDDLGSSNGTFLNGERVEGKARIRAGDFIKFGIFKVAVAKQGAARDDGPKVVSLKDRSDSAAKSCDMPSSISATSATRRVGLADSVAGPPAAANSAPPALLENEFAATRQDESDALRISEKVEEKSRKELESLIEALETEKEKISARLSEREESSRHLVKSNGRLHAELNRESAEAAQLRETLEETRGVSSGLREEIDLLKKELFRREAELREKDQACARAEGDLVFDLKRELGEARSAKKQAEESMAKIAHEKLSLAGSFERLKSQLAKAETMALEASKREEGLQHEKGLLARRLEKAEAGNSELASRIREDASAALANRELVGKLELQLRETELESARREQQRVAQLQDELRRVEETLKGERKEREGLEARLAAIGAARKSADETVLRLQEKILELESERESTRSILRETERKRAQLAAALADQAELAENRGKKVEELANDLAATVCHSEASENTLLAAHREKLESLLSELENEQEHRRALETELENTRAGMSDALRFGRRQAEREQSKVLAESNEKIAEIEDELSRAILSREQIEESRHCLEDALNEREGRVDQLVEKIDDLELQIRDGEEAKESLRNEMQRSREGFSGALRANWMHLGEARIECRREEMGRLAAEDEAATAQVEVKRLERELEEVKEQFRAEVEAWDARYENLREEKVTLDTENTNLTRLRDEIGRACSEKSEVDFELSRLSRALRELQERNGELKEENVELLSERGQLRAELSASRAEMESIQRRCVQFQSREEKLTEIIESAERRIQALKNLESQMEQAMERKRQQGIVSRSEIFSTTEENYANGDGRVTREEFYRKLISKLDLIDDLSKRYDNRWRYPKVSEQLGVLKSSFVNFLEDHSVREFQLAPGTVLSSEERRRIKLVPVSEFRNGKKSSHAGNGSNGSNGSNAGNGSRSCVVETIRPGYVFREGSRDIVIRKAEVVVA